MQEMMRLQGVDTDLPVVGPEMHFRRLLGNAMSVNVLERILCALLPASGLWPQEALVDRYSELSHSAKRQRCG